MDRKEAQGENLRRFLSDGPRLSYDYQVWVVVRAPGRVLLGGLGCMGVGEMWFEDDGRYRDYPSYDDALFVDV